MIAIGDLTATMEENGVWSGDEPLVSYLNRRFPGAEKYEEPIEQVIEAAAKQLGVSMESKTKSWDESKHPRHGAGSEKGGQFSEKDEPSTREEKIEALKEMGARYRYDNMDDWGDDLIDRIYSDRKKEVDDKIELMELASWDAADAELRIATRELNDKEELRRLARIYKVDISTLENELKWKIEAAKEVLRKKGGLGTVAVVKDWSLEKPPNAKSIKELEEWWRERGVFARFGLPDDVEREDQSDWEKEQKAEGKKFRYDLEDANTMTAEMVNLFKQYPDANIKEFGLAYSLEKAKWDDNFARNLEIEYREKEKETAKTGKRWSRAAAKKRVLKKMFNEPPKNREDSKRTVWHGDWDMMRLAWANEKKASIQFNHRSRFLIGNKSNEEWKARRDKEIKSDQQRLSEGKKVRFTDNVGDGALIGTVRHEFGHAVDYSSGISEHPKMKRLWEDSQGDLPSGLSTKIKVGLSDYAETNIKEFIAEGFTEAISFDDSRPMSRDIRDTMDEIIDEKDRERRGIK